ncbi:MAG: ribonuclease HI [Verrucomicrobiales bacterium]|nr:ribonuclease HI [Verrucomicrobiales bacterium]
MKEVTIYTDGSSRGNPGPGGFGTVLLFNGREKRLNGGFEKTTNNRMEILAALEGLRALKEPCEVTVFSDSKYLVNAFTKGWLENWKRMGWKRKKDQPLKNADLWQEMDEAIRDHRINWQWVKGHAGHRFNEICDQLATEAADGKNRAVDEGYLAEESGEAELF